MTFNEFKENLCKKIYLSDICYNNINVFNQFWDYKKCKIPVLGIPDLLYLVSTAYNKLYLKQRIKNYNGYSRFLEDNKKEIIEQIENL